MAPVRTSSTHDAEPSIDLVARRSAGAAKSTHDCRETGLAFPRTSRTVLPLLEQDRHAVYALFLAGKQAMLLDTGLGQRSPRD